jgi:NAD-dependent deacetylase
MLRLIAMTQEDEAARALRAIADGDHVVWLTGAGLSVASGLAPYRKSKDAVWSNFILDWGTIEKFHQDPARWYREFWWKAHRALHEPPGSVRPNAGHEAITRFLLRRPHHCVITQNIDRLHLVAGAPAERTIEIHGRFDTFCCANLNCAEFQTPHTDLMASPTSPLPLCRVCHAILRPVVLLFDEYYHSHSLYRSREALRWLDDADVIVCVGTSFSVGITALALQAARAHDAKLVNVNVDPVDELGFLNVIGPSEQSLPALAAAILDDHPQ